MRIICFRRSGRTRALDRWRAEAARRAPATQRGRIVRMKERCKPVSARLDGAAHLGDMDGLERMGPTVETRPAPLRGCGQHPRGLLDVEREARAPAARLRGPDRR